MSDELAILLWWLLFTGTHLIGSSVPVRTALIRSIGLRGFKGLYSLVAFATFIPLCVVYARNKHAGEVLYDAPEALWWLTHVLMFLALVVLIQGLVTPSPLVTSAEMSGKFTDTARGIQRITRHPQNLAFALFGAAHMLVNPTVGDWIFFGGFVVYAVVSAVHQDRRTRATGPEAVQRFQAQTSLVPFAAILRGRQRLALGEWKKGPFLVAAVLFVVLRVLHGRIFGGFGG